MGVGKARHEIKHYINYADMVELRARLPLIAKPDPNGGAEKRYRVRSLYFDNYNDRALQEKMFGVNMREKFRLRFYSGDTSYIRLEKKSKRNGYCFKESAVVSEEECRRLLALDYSALKENGSPLCLELYAKMQYRLLRAKNIVDYWREAYIYEPSNVRITLDYDIRTMPSAAGFLDKQAPLLPTPPVYILEVKYDEFLPEVIRNLVSLANRRATAFSKYAATRII